jgi:SPP1 gp7 family putative phage head morphogenesis protein
VSRISGPDTRDVATRAEKFVDIVDSAVWHTLDAVTRRLNGAVTLDSISGINTEWQLYVPALRNHIGQTYIDSAVTQRALQRDALVSVLSERSDTLVASSDPGVFEIPLVANATAEALMANAGNRLANVGNEVWEVARGQLLTGLQNGESTSALRDRVMTAADFSASRAEVIARSEIAYAMNAGSLAQMKQINAPGMTKEWIAVHDGRTRSAHAALDGKKIGINQSFAGGLEPGVEPNCRCTYGFDIPDDELEEQCDC